MKKKAVQPNKAGKYVGVEADPETGKRKSSGGQGSSAPAPAPGLDVCLLYEEDSDPDAYLFPLPMIDEGCDSPSLCRDKCSSTREPPDQCAHRRSGRTFPPNRRRRSRCIKQMARRWLTLAPKFLSMGVGNNQKTEGTFDVRNVTMPIVAAGQVTDEGHGVWLSGNGGHILDMRSAKKIERLLGDKSSFIKLKKQKGVYVNPWSRNSQARWTEVMLGLGWTDQQE